MRTRCFIWLLACCCAIVLFAPPAASQSLNVHHLTTGNGLADGVVRCLGQDKYGYIWIGSLTGLSRYNGYTVTVFQSSPRDSSGMPYEPPYSILGDKAGHLWIGFARGLYYYDFATSRFQLVKGTAGIAVSHMLQFDDATIFLLSSKGLLCFNPQTKQFKMMSKAGIQNAALFEQRIHDLSVYDKSLYLATDMGVVKYDVHNKTTLLLQDPSFALQKITRLAIDKNGTMWAAYGKDRNQLLKTDVHLRNIKEITPFPGLKQEQGNSITNLLIDHEQRLWICSALSGLVLFEQNKEVPVQFTHDPSQQSSPAANHFNFLFQARDGFIWGGTEGYGADYFRPGRQLFRTVVPEEEEQRKALPALWARTAVEDAAGNVWMGWGGGITIKTPSGRMELIKNNSNKPEVLHNNSIRSLIKDQDDNIWIGTSRGVNRYNAATKRIDFLYWKDSVPQGFIWVLAKDSRNTIWIGSGNQLSYYDAVQKRFFTSASHPVLRTLPVHGVRAIYEDSRKCIWFGLNGGGLILYDPQQQKAKHWLRTDDNNTTIVSNTITAITEDKKGIVWISSFLGLMAYDPVTGLFKQYTRAEGLPSVKTSCLMVDAQNRLWIGSTSGIILLNGDRTYFKTYDGADGLPTTEFNDQSATRLHDGSFLFPSLKGFIKFHPDDIKDTAEKKVPLVAGISIYDQPLKAATNYEELGDVSLRYNQNFFSFEMVALNYANPQQTWYAYKLDGFDKDWVYSKDRTMHYTNVPGGKYVFRYKATINPNDWNVPEKTITVTIGHIFYKTIWFWTIVAAIAFLLIYWLYRNRLHQREKVFSLQSKAQLLEKEKAMVMYESLKQQLNPHFLFNSLTSLNSLIQTADTELAAGFLDSLSRIYRYILKSRDSETVPLIDELRFAETYIKLQSTRFEKGFEVKINVAEDDYHRKIVPVTLQNLVENAIKHNIIDEETPLVVEIFVEQNKLVVRNNLQKKKFVETSNRQGLANLQSLYNYLSNQPVEIIESDESFMIRIPLL